MHALRECTLRSACTFSFYLLSCIICTALFPPTTCHVPEPHGTHIQHMPAAHKTALRQHIAHSTQNTMRHTRHITPHRTIQHHTTQHTTAHHATSHHITPHHTAQHGTAWHSTNPLRRCFTRHCGGLCARSRIDAGRRAFPTGGQRSGRGGLRLAQGHVRLRLLKGRRWFTGDREGGHAGASPWRAVQMGAWLMDTIWGGGGTAPWRGLRLTSSRLRTVVLRSEMEHISQNHPHTPPPHRLGGAEEA